MNPQINPGLERVTAKAIRRLVPFLLLKYVLAFLDRANIGFAKQAFRLDTGVSNAAYAFGAGIFFIGYALFEVPSNLIMHRVGAAAAGGIALINSIGSLGGFFAPNVKTWAEKAFESPSAGLYLLAGTTLLGAALFLALRARQAVPAAVIRSA